MKPWLQLLRISNLPTTISNVLVGFLITHQAWQPEPTLWFLIIASCCFYSAGMVLNDVFDVEVDRVERPERPIPSNRISLNAARTTGMLLLVFGLICCTVAGYLAQSSDDSIQTLPLMHQPLPRVVGVGTLLVVMILLYDGPLKRTLMASPTMGACRTLNILLGGATFLVAPTATSIDPILGLPWLLWSVAGALGLLIWGTTLLGRREAQATQPSGPLFIAVCMIVTALAGYASLVYCPVSSDFSKAIVIAQSVTLRYWIFLLIVGGTILRRVLGAAFSPSPKSVQLGVVTILRSLILIDAAVCYHVSNGNILYPLVVAALMLPTFALGRYIRST